MKIKNDLIRIQINNKKYDFHNMIMFEYLRRFANAQLSEQNINKISFNKNLRYCLLKFDTPFENLTQNSTIHNQDFDIGLLTMTNSKQEMNNKKITVEYQYNNFNQIYDESTQQVTEDITPYLERKITAIGFNNQVISDEAFENKFPVCAILDTSNYDIYLSTFEDFVITRRDIISSDAEFYSPSSLVTGPAHLAPLGTPQIIDQPNIYEDNAHTSWKAFYDNGYGILYSIGFSSYPDYIDKEFVIGTDISISSSGDFLASSIFRNELEGQLIYPELNLYPSLGNYPLKNNYKYVILKYKIWQMVHSGTYEEVISTPTDTGLFYYEALPLNKIGNLRLFLNYEGG